MSRADRRAKQRVEAKKRQQAERRRARGGGGSLVSPRVARIVSLAVIAVVVLGAAGFGIYAYIKSPLHSQKVVATVNGNDITQAELTRRERVFQFLTGITGPLDPATSQDLLDELEEGYLLTDAAAARNVSPATPEEVKKLTDQWSASVESLYGNKLGVTIARLRLGVRAADLEAYAQVMALKQKLYDALTASVTVSDADVEAFYTKYKETLDQQGLSLETARDTLAEEALSEKKGEVFTQFLDSLKASADIKTPE